MASGAAAWSVKGIDEKTRNVAREAAAASGLTIGEWIDRTIRLQAATVDGAASEIDPDPAAGGMDPLVGDQVPSSTPEIAAVRFLPSDSTSVSAPGIVTGPAPDPRSAELLDFLDTELERARKRIDRSLVPIGRVLHDLAVRIVETEGRRSRGAAGPARFEPALSSSGSDNGSSSLGSAEASALEDTPENESGKVGFGESGLERREVSVDDDSERTILDASPRPQVDPKEDPEAAATNEKGLTADDSSDDGWDDGWDDPIWSGKTATVVHESPAPLEPEDGAAEGSELAYGTADHPVAASAEEPVDRAATPPRGEDGSENVSADTPVELEPSPMVAMPRSRAMADYVADAPDPRHDLSDRPVADQFEEPDPSDYPDLAPEPEDDFSPSISSRDIDEPPEETDPRDEGRHEEQRDQAPGAGPLGAAVEGLNGVDQVRSTRDLAGDAEGIRSSDLDDAPDPSGDFDRRVRLDEAIDHTDDATDREKRSAGALGVSSEPSTLEDRLNALRRAAARDNNGDDQDPPRDDATGHLASAHGVGAHGGGARKPIPGAHPDSPAPSLSVDERGPSVRFTGHQAGFESHPDRAVSERSHARWRRVATWSKRAATALAAAIALAVVGAWFAADRLGLQEEKAEVSDFLERKSAEIKATLTDAGESLSEGGFTVLMPTAEKGTPAAERSPLASIEIPKPADQTQAAGPAEPPLVPPIPPSRQAAAPPSVASAPTAPASGTRPALPRSEGRPAEEAPPEKQASERSGAITESAGTSPRSKTSDASPDSGGNTALGAVPPPPPAAPALPGVDVARVWPPGGGTAPMAESRTPGPGPLHLAWLQDQARRGDPRAQHDLALLHYDGAGVARDPIKAADWFREAAIQGDANAQYNLGVLYEKGLGVRQDDVRALLWYHSAAEQSHAVAQLNLGTLYAEGRGIPLSYDEAKRWFRAAAENGIAAGYYNLGVLTEAGLGGRPDEPAALDLYRLAAEMGHSGASARLEREAADPDAVKPADMQLAKTLGLERTERLDVPVVVEIQARLGGLGVYSGRIDGVAGPRTREAIRDYEAAKGLPVTGSPSDALLRHLRDATEGAAGKPPVTG